MDSKKQKLLLEYLVSSSDVFALCQGIVQPEFFDPEFRQAVSFVQKYYQEYNTTPKIKQIKAETGVEIEKHKLSIDEIEYAADEIETFCRRRALERAILASPKLIEKGDYGAVEDTIKQAILLSLNRNLGVRYFDNVAERLEQMSEQSITIPTGWTEVDEALFGGISRKELLLVSANSGGGKSLTLANLAFNFVHQGYDVLFISLELAENIVAQRFDTMFTGVSRRVWKAHKSEIVTKVEGARGKCGVLDIIKMPSGTKSLEIRAFLKEYFLHYNKMPDLLVLDYIDEMAPNEFVSADNVWEKDKRCSVQLREIGVDYNMAIATASQLNREAVNASHHTHAHIAGGISKINVADVYWSIVMTDTMRAKGEIVFNLQKTRNSDGVGKTIYLRWDNQHLRIVDREKTSSNEIKFNKRKGFLQDESTTEGSGLLDLMSNI